MVSSSPLDGNGERVLKISAFGADGHIHLPKEEGKVVGMVVRDSCMHLQPLILHIPHVYVAVHR